MDIELKKIEEVDLPNILGWVESGADMVQWSGPWFTFPLDLEQLQQFFLSPNNRQFKATFKETGEMVGQVGFSFVWQRLQTANLGPVIVSPNHRNQGIGTQMIKKVLRIGFEELRVHRIELRVFDFNVSAIRCYENAGFKREGLLREGIEVDGDYWNWIMMSILEHEWRNLTDK